MDFIKCVWLVFRHFKNPYKTYLWFTTPNPMLGRITAMHLVRIGRSWKLLQVIKNLLNGYMP